MAIYDCFTFYNEFELLMIRMTVLNDVVDYFVIVEANKTQKGKYKEFNFEKRKDEFGQWANRIIYIKGEDAPECDGIDDWRIENYQRNCILDGLKNCKPDDLIIISDVDEIPRPELIRNFYDEKLSFTKKRNKGIIKKLYHSIPQIIHPMNFFKTVKDVIEDGAVALEMDVYYYYLNCRSRGVIWTSILVKYKNIRTPQYWRNERERLPKIKNAGWHFSYLGGMKKIKEKLHAIIEGDDQLDSDEYIEKCLTEGKDLYGRKGREFEYDFIEENEIGLDGAAEFIRKYPYLCKKIKK
jgi:beta-1,4-mannosyl-glycoprotein beta-1,4-N-acetylglucosaminyltransferase